MKSRDWLICAAILAVLFAFTTRQEDPTEFSLWSGQEARQGEVLVQNSTCADFTQYRTVPDAETNERLLDLCRQMEEHRPFLIIETLLGEHVTECFTLRTEDTRYTVLLVEVEKQLALDYIHREQPIVYFSKTKLNEEGQWKGESWYCKLPAAEFAALCQTIRSYDGGEIVIP